MARKLFRPELSHYGDEINWILCIYIASADVNQQVIAGHHRIIRETLQHIEIIL
jgi:hypothetical protein